MGTQSFCKSHHQGIFILPPQNIMGGSNERVMWWLKYCMFKFEHFENLKFIFYFFEFTFEKFCMMHEIVKPILAQTDLWSEIF